MNWNKETANTFEENTCWLRPEQDNKWNKSFALHTTVTSQPLSRNPSYAEVNFSVYVMGHVNFESQTKDNFSWLTSELGS
jgi:hypothetical protein